MRDEIVRIYKVPADKIKLISPKSANWLKEILETYKNVAEGRAGK
jgi:hypothetical protein